MIHLFIYLFKINPEKNIWWSVVAERKTTEAQEDQYHILATAKLMWKSVEWDCIKTKTRLKSFNATLLSTSRFSVSCRAEVRVNRPARHTLNCQKKNQWLEESGMARENDATIFTHIHRKVKGNYNIRGTVCIRCFWIKAREA